MTATPRLVKSLTQVNGTDALLQIDGQVAPLNDGGYVVVWTDSSLTYNPLGTAIVGQRYDSVGTRSVARSRSANSPRETSSHPRSRPCPMETSLSRLPIRRRAI
jgi:hypothetical protein